MQQPHYLPFQNSKNLLMNTAFQGKPLNTSGIERVKNSMNVTVSPNVQSSVAPGNDDRAGGAPKGVATNGHGHRGWNMKARKI